MHLIPSQNLRFIYDIDHTPSDGIFADRLADEIRRYKFAGADYAKHINDIINVYFDSFRNLYVLGSGKLATYEIRYGDYLNINIWRGEDFINIIVNDQYDNFIFSPDSTCINDIFHSCVLAAIFVYVQCGGVNELDFITDVENYIFKYEIAKIETRDVNTKCT